MKTLYVIYLKHGSHCNCFSLKDLYVNVREAIKVGWVIEAIEAL